MKKDYKGKIRIKIDIRKAAIGCVNYFIIEQFDGKSWIKVEEIIEDVKE